eukprot:TRINITY_DN22010_c0_g2_i1.p2 TRINITY_DN22010_c0_g2~~TRINITY_DN22010_c0_g2_i1.p2  ORF type:complete len:73 (-),score=0.06 TRINITY_DN22010_c0_g2_i1:57-275(-)
MFSHTIPVETPDSMTKKKLPTKSWDIIESNKMKQHKSNHYNNHKVRATSPKNMFNENFFNMKKSNCHNTYQG